MENTAEISNPVVAPEPAKSTSEPVNTVVEKTSDSSESVAQKARNPKGKKRKKPKDINSPKSPVSGISGYVRFLSDKRDGARTAHPNLSLADITKLLASEWSVLPEEDKKKYLEAASDDRARYAKELKAYKETDAYKQFIQQQYDMKMKEAKDEPQPVPKSQTVKDTQNNNEIDFSNFDIPIFTEEFLDHNKTRDAELRQLRKSNTDYEQQNATLQKHIESMKLAIEKLEGEVIQQKKNNCALQQHLDHLRTTLTNGFSDVKLPGVKEVATLPTIDNYMTNLHSMLLENSSHDATLLQTVRDIVGRLEFNG